MAGLRVPSHGRSRQTRYRTRPSAEGRSDWLNLLRKKLSFSTPNRFIPAHPEFCLFAIAMLRWRRIPEQGIEIQRPIKVHPNLLISPLSAVRFPLSKIPVLSRSLPGGKMLRNRAMRDLL
jgi:hypothetical protein